MSRLFLCFFVVIQGLILSACSGIQTYPNKASAGDTVTVGLGWQKNFNRNNTTVHITPALGSVITLEPGDPAIRALVNFYPDPVSYMIIGTETQQNSADFNYGGVYGNLITSAFTGGDKDMWQTSAFIDLPVSLPLGDALIELENDIGETVSSSVLIVAGEGAPDRFNAEFNGPLSPVQLASLERSPHFEVAFSGPDIPHAIEVIISHAPDLDHGGTGKAYVVNPRGDIKNIFWSSTGSVLKVHIMPARMTGINNFHDFKFYLAGGVEGPVIDDVKAYDIDGNLMPDVTALLE